MDCVFVCSHPDLVRRQAEYSEMRDATYQTPPSSLQWLPEVWVGLRTGYDHEKAIPSKDPKRYVKL